MSQATPALQKSYPFVFWICTLLLTGLSYWGLASPPSREGTEAPVFAQKFSIEEVHQILFYQEPKPISQEEPHDHSHSHDPLPQKGVEYERKNQSVPPPLSEEQIAEKIVLSRDRDDWVSSSHHSALCTDSVEELFEILFPLKQPFLGEVRTADAGYHHVFALEPSQAIHLVLKNKQGKKLAHLILGKDDSLHRRTFVRDWSASSEERRNSVFLVGPSLRAFLNVPELTDQISQKTLLDLSLISQNWLEEKQLKITELRIMTPLSYYEMSLKTYFPPQVRGNQLVTEEWFLRAPFTGVLNESFASILKILSNLVAEDVAYPPTDLKQHQLEKPPFEVRIIYSGAEQKEVALGFNLTPDQKWVGRFLSENYAYQFSEFDGKSLFGSFGDFVELHPFGFSANASKLVVEKEGERYVLEKLGRYWRLIDPPLPFPIQQEKVQACLATLADLRPANVVTKKNLEEVFTVDTKNYAHIQLTVVNTIQSLRVGPENPANPKEERFVVPSSNVRNGIFTVKTKDIDLAIPKLKELIEMKLFQGDFSVANQLEIQVAEKTILWKKEDQQWKCESSFETQTDIEALSQFLKECSSLKGEGLVASTSPKNKIAYYKITLPNNRTIAFQLWQNEQEYALEIEGVNFIISVSSEVAKMLLALIPKH